MKSLFVTCPGRVAAQGSKVKGKRGNVYEASKYLPAWRKAVVGCAEDALLRNLTWRRDADAVRVEIVFAFPRPAAHYGTGRNATRLRPDAPLYYAQTPDIDKCVRAVLDALTLAGVYADDRRVVQLDVTQVYCDRRTTSEPGAQIIVSEVGEW